MHWVWGTVSSLRHSFHYWSPKFISLPPSPHFHSPLPEGDTGIPMQSLSLDGSLESLTEAQASLSHLKEDPHVSVTSDLKKKNIACLLPASLNFQWWSRDSFRAQNLPLGTG